MDLNNLVKIIPQLILFFIPGYIAIELCRDFRQEYKTDEKRLIIRSIIWSFIINLIMDSFIALFNKGHINKANLFYQSGLLILAVFIGYVMSKLPDIKWISDSKYRFLKIKILPYATVWNSALQAEKGSWVIVYFDKNDYAYKGILKEFSSNPNFDNKEMLLSNYSIFQISTGEPLSQLDFTNDNNAQVYLNAKEVTRVEIFKA